MKSFFTIAGIICLVYSLFTIFSDLDNCSYNEQQAKEHPVITTFSGGSNLRDNAYNYQSPFTDHEVGMIILVVVGAGMTLTGFCMASKKS